MPAKLHKNPHSDRAAVAPYNFVPMADRVMPAQDLPARDRYHADRHTGVVQCKLTAHTPLYTRAALEPHEAAAGGQAKDKSDFFYIDPATKEPVIPGSSLRGMVRSVLEIVTDSKLQPVTDRQLFYRTLDTSALGERYRGRMTGGDAAAEGWYPLTEAGYLERRGNHYFIRPARSLNGTRHYRVDEATALNAIPRLREMAFENDNGAWRPNRRYEWRRLPVWFIPTAPALQAGTAQRFALVTQISTADQSPAQGWHKGTLIASGWVPSRGGRGKKRHWIVGPPDTQAEPIAVAEIDIDAYRERSAGITRDIERFGFSAIPQSDGETVACFYTRWVDSNGTARVAFGHTAMFRLPYTLSPRDLLPPEHLDPNTIDLAEAIFGRVVENGKAIAGRVYFGDARLTHMPDRREPAMPLLLSGPKPTAVQHYLAQSTDDTAHLDVYDPNADGEPATLRGHKRYWHRGSAALDQAIEDARESQAQAQAQDKEDSTQTTIVHPVPAGTTFTFTIHFENLTAVELGALLWTLQLPGAPGERYCHKLGLGKPVGLGSAQIGAKLHLSDRVERYRQLFDDAAWRPTAQAAETPAEPYQAAFEAFMMPAADAAPARSFAATPRMRMLLAMLRWPGPGVDETRYLRIKPQNEYRYRPVLPNPLYVVDSVERDLADAAPRARVEQAAPETESFGDNRTHEFSQDEIAGIMDAIASPAQTEVTDTTPVRLTGSGDAIPGRRVLGTVARIDNDRLKIDVGLPDLADLPYKQAQPRVKHQKQAQTIFAIGQEIVAEITGVTGTGIVQLRMK